MNRRANCCAAASPPAFVGDLCVPVGYRVRTAGLVLPALPRDQLATGALERVEVGVIVVVRVVDGAHRLECAPRLGREREITPGEARRRVLGEGQEAEVVPGEEDARRGEARPGQLGPVGLAAGPHVVAVRGDRASVHGLGGLDLLCGQAVRGQRGAALNGSRVPMTQPRIVDLSVDTAGRERRVVQCRDRRLG